MGYRRKNGWPATLRELVLEGVSNGLDLALDGPYEDFQGYFEVVEGKKRKTYLKTPDNLNLMGFYCRGPDKEGFYQIQIRVLGRYYDYFYVYPRDSHSRCHAESAVCDIVVTILSNFLDNEMTLFVWEFEDSIYPELKDVKEETWPRRRRAKGKD